VTVTTGSSTLTSNVEFRVKPTFLSFSPTSGPVGTPVTITGTALTQTTKVTFGGVAATTFAVNSDSQVTANVPTGAVTGKIVIKTNGGTAASKTSFTVN
jgi:IPT/TIG domain